MARGWAGISQSKILRALQGREAHAAAMDAYQPRPIDAPRVLFKTAALNDEFETIPGHGWSNLTPDFEVITEK